MLLESVPPEVEQTIEAGARGEAETCREGQTLRIPSKDVIAWARKAA